MVLKSEIEKDVQHLVTSLKDDYRIPSSGEIIFPVIKVLSVVYFMHVVAIIANEFYYDEDIWFPGVVMWFVLSCVILTALALVMTYGNLSLLMCIPKEVRNKSLLISIGKKKLMTYGYVTIAINFVVAIILITGNHEFIFGYGISWFACMIIGGITFSMSMSRYMTPAVVATIDKIRQVVSVGEIEPSKPASE